MFFIEMLGRELGRDRKLRIPLRSTTPMRAPFVTTLVSILDTRPEKRLLEAV